MPDPEISIIIVSWNVRDLVIACLRSLARFVSTPHEVVVIDNHSADGTVEALGRQFPDITVIANAQNEGFAKACHQGWQRSRGRYICCLNPDTEFINDTFPELVAYLRSHDRVGCIGPKLLNSDRSDQPSVRRFPRFLDQALILLKLRPFTTWLTPLTGYYQRNLQAQPEPQAVDQLMGAMLVLPRTVLSKIGFFDPGYWIWFEEVDLCQRLHRAGYSVVYDPTAQIIHHGGRSFAQHYSLAKQVWFLKSLARYVRKYWRPWPRYALLALMPVSYILTMVQTLFKPR